MRNIPPRFAPFLFFFAAAFLPILNAIPSAVSMPHVRRIILPTEKNRAQCDGLRFRRPVKQKKNTFLVFLFILHAG